MVERKIILIDHVAVGHDIKQSCHNPASIIRTRKLSENVKILTHEQVTSHTSPPVFLFYAIGWVGHIQTKFSTEDQENADELKLWQRNLASDKTGGNPQDWVLNRKGAILAERFCLLQFGLNSNASRNCGHIQVFERLKSTNFGNSLACSFCWCTEARKANIRITFMIFSKEEYKRCCEINDSAFKGQMSD